MVFSIANSFIHFYWDLYLLKLTKLFYFWVLNLIEVSSPDVWWKHSSSSAPLELVKRNPCSQTLGKSECTKEECWSQKSHLLPKRSLRCLKGQSPNVVIWYEIKAKKGPLNIHRFISEGGTLNWLILVVCAHILFQSLRYPEKFCRSWILTCSNCTMSQT